MKSQIIERLGQTDILLPSLIAEGLAANDRVKARLSVLQAAGRHARDPGGLRFDLANECRAGGIDPVAMETLVNGASPLAGERITAPGLGNLGTAIWGDVATMVRAVKAGDAAQGDIALERLSAIKGAASPETSDTIELAQITRLTGISGGNGDVVFTPAPSGALWFRRSNINGDWVAGPQTLTDGPALVCGEFRPVSSLDASG